MLFYPPAYATKAPNTKNMHVKNHADIAVKVVLGCDTSKSLKMLTRTKTMVTRSDMRPGIESAGIRKLTHETLTKSPLGM